MSASKTPVSQNDLAACVTAALQRRRSIRAYTKQDVTDAQLMTILEAGRWAPSGLNNQPFRFLALKRGDQRIPELAPLTKYSHIVEQAAALIGVFLFKENMYHQLKDHQAAGACVQNIMLATHALGLGSVWLGQMMNNAPKVLHTLKLSEEQYEFITFIALGHPQKEGVPSRKPLEEYMLESL